MAPHSGAYRHHRQHGAVVISRRTLPSQSCCLDEGDQVNLGPLIAALITVETGGCRNPDLAVGDGGAAIGALQIHRAVVVDANRIAGTSYTHQQMTNRVAARRVCEIYLSRYASGKTNEEAARIWNGGPTGYKKSATLAYWNKVKRNL